MSGLLHMAHDCQLYKKPHMKAVSGGTETNVEDNRLRF